MKDNYLNLLVRYGVSDTLVGLLQAVAESEGLNGRRYSTQVGRELNRLILCRNQNKTLWRLAHLLAVIETTQQSRQQNIHQQGACINFFWVDENITSARLREAFHDPVEVGGVRVVCRESLRITYPDGEFVLAPAATPLLAAMLEFVVAIVPEFWQRLADLAEDTTLQAVGLFANYLQSSMHSYLQDHLQPLQQQRKARSIIQWLDTPDALPMGDAVGLAYWQYALAEGIADFRLFNSVGDSLLNLHTVQDSGHTSQMLEGARTLGTDVESGEVDPEQLATECVQLETTFSPLAALRSSTLVDIKFLTEKDMRSLGLLDHAPSACCALPLTLARMAVFGTLQVSIAQYLRKSANAEVQRLLVEGPDSNYNTFIERLNSLLEKVETTRLCILHMLVESKHPAAAHLLVDALDTESQEDLRHRLLAGESAATSDTLISELLSALPELALQMPTLNKVLRSAKSAFKAVNRRGFDQIPSELDIYVEGETVLRALRAHIENYQGALLKSFADVGSEATFTADLQAFRSIFKEMYGEGQ